ncbi:MAG TPA: ATP-binding protein [Anaerolineales bacterium]|nr:ATP-binding protein [Anaerolineales bacterium]
MSVIKPSPFWKRVGAVLHSIRFRLVLWYSVILAIVLVVFSLFVYINQVRDIHGDSQFRLERKMAALEVGVTVTPNGLLVPPGVLQDTDVLVFLGPTGEVLASHGPLPAQSVVQLAARAEQESEHNRTPVGGITAWMEGGSSPQANYIFVTVPILGMSGRGGLVILGSPADPYGLVNKLLFTLIAGSLLTLVIALLGGYWLADRAMRPVHTITQTARSIGETDLSRRLNMKSKDELGELADTFDGMLGRLQAAFERQRQFVADASHELRTPLTIVNLETSRALAARRSADDYQHALTVIRSENDFMTSLVNDLLMLARMDAGQTMIEKEPVDLSDVAVETVERLNSLAARKGVRLETGDLPEARLSGDRQYLIQMVSNLVENGIKYTDGEDKWVRIETGAADGSTWVRVSDNGPGIPPEHIPHLFERFYRIDKSRTRMDEQEGETQSPTGSGLGLSIVQWIARSHGGEVRVDSVPGSGTSFEVRFKTD